MLYIENDGALFRGPARGVPLEVWIPRLGKFMPYADANRPRDISWGNVIDEAEASAMMRESSAAYEQEVYGDIPMDGTPLSQAYHDRVMPDHVKARIAEVAGRKRSKP